MNLSAFIDAQCLAATLVFQIKKAIRANTAIVGPYSAFSRVGPVSGILGLAIGPELRELFLHAQTGALRQFAIGQVDVVGVDILPREDYPYETGGAGRYLQGLRRLFSLVAPFDGGSLDTLRLAFDPIESRNGFRTRLTLEILVYDPSNPSQSGRVLVQLDIDVHFSNVRIGAGIGVRSGISLILQPGRLALSRANGNPAVDLYQFVVAEADTNRQILAGTMLGPVRTAVNDAYQQLLNSILRTVRDESAFAPNGISEAVSRVLNRAFGRFTLIPLNMGMRFVRSERGDYIQVLLQLTEGAMTTDLVGGAFVVDAVRSFRRQLRSETELMWRNFFVDTPPPRSDQLLGVSVASSLVAFLIVTSLGRAIDELLTQLTGERRSAANSMVIDAVFSQEVVTPELKHGAASFLDWFFRPGACNVQDLLAPRGTRVVRTSTPQAIEDVRRRQASEPESITPADQLLLDALDELESARKAIANVLSRRYTRPESITPNDRQLLDALDSACAGRAELIRTFMEMDGYSEEDAVRASDQVVVRSVTAAYDRLGTAMPPAPWEMYRARATLERADRDCPVRREAIAVEVARGSDPFEAVRSVTRRFERAWEIAYRLASPGSDMSMLEAREITRQLESRCPGLSVFRERFVGLLAAYPVLAYEYERSNRLIAEGLPGKRVVDRNVQNVVASLAGPVDQYVFSRLEGPFIRWSASGLEVDLKVLVQESLGLLGTIIRNLALVSVSGSVARAEVDISLWLTLATTNPPGTQSRLEARADIYADFSRGLLSVLGASPFMNLAQMFAAVGGQPLFREALISALFDPDGSDPSPASEITSALSEIFPPGSTVVSLTADGESESLRLLIVGFAEALFGPRSSIGSELSFESLLRDPMPSWVGFTSTGISLFVSPFDPDQALERLLGVDREFFRLLRTSIAFGFDRDCAEYGLIIQIDFVLAVAFDVAFVAASFVDSYAASLGSAMRLEHVWLGPEGPRWDRNRLPSGLFVFPAGDDGIAGLEFFVPASAIASGYERLVGQPVRIFLTATVAVPVIVVGDFPPQLPSDAVNRLDVDCRYRRVRL